MTRRLRRVSVSAMFLLAGALAAARASAQNPVQANVDLSGEWTVKTFGATWRVALAPSDSAASDGGGPMFCGAALRDGKGKDGKPITSMLCALVLADKNVLRVAVFGVTCEAPFKPDAKMRGLCAMSGMAGGPGGDFEATRAKPKQ